LLSSPRTILKLFDAAILRLATTPAEELVGSGLKHIPVLSDVMKLAPRQGGGWNTKNLSALVTRGFTKGISDAWELAKTGSDPLDKVFGKSFTLSLKEAGVEEQSFIDMIGKIHGMMKSTTKRGEFEFSMATRLDHAVKNKVDIFEPAVLLRIGIEAYQDAYRAIFQQDNVFTSAYKRGLMALEEIQDSTGKPSAWGKAAAFTLKNIMPIVKVPTNIVAEQFEYATGLATGSYRLGRAIKNGMKNLTPQESDLIARNLKKGLLGSAFLTLGYLNPNVFGGYYQPGEHRKKGDVKWGSARVFGVNVPSYLIHSPLMELLQFGSTIRRVAHNTIDDPVYKQLAGVEAALLGMSSETPLIDDMTGISKMFGPQWERAQFKAYMAGRLVPQLSHWEAQREDVNAEGNPIHRSPKTVLQGIEAGIPGLRQNVPRSKNQD
jgi:hypothetical protein